MCFSVQADLGVGAALLPVGVVALREVRRPRELPFAALPLLFAGHQLVEAGVWARFDGTVSAGVGRAAAVVYVLYALVVLPTLVPTAVLALEPRARRRRMVPLVALGVVVSVVLLYALIRHGVTAVEHAHAVEYQVGVPLGALWAVLYVVAVVGPALLSGYRSIVAFGVLNLVGLVVVALLYTREFASVWCIYAALASVLVVTHLYRRRRLDGAERLA